MNTVFYKIECLTNLHVGSGEINYNIIDNEVEKDPVTGFPMIHAPGIKGALRDAFKKTDPDLADKVFGKPGKGDFSVPGTHKFLDAHLISRPMRVSGSPSLASINVVSIASINAFLADLSAFGANEFGIDSIEAPDFGDNLFLTNEDNIMVEGEKTGILPDAFKNQLLKLSSIIGAKFAVVSSFEGFDLPVIARNYLENGISKNLWYEEIVPHGSVFYFAVICNESDDDFSIPKIVQFGGNSSIGCGYCEVTKIQGDLK